MICRSVPPLAGPAAHEAAVPGRRPAARGGTILALAALLPVLVAGCVSVASAPEVRPGTEPAVSRLGNNIEGFAIEERAGVDSEARSAFARAVEQLEQEHYDEAIALLQQVIERAPELTAPQVDIAIAYERRGEPEAAEEHLKKALEQVPGHPVASNTYGLLLRKSGRFAEAREVYEAALERFPEYLPIRKNLGILCELYLDDPAAALEQYELYSEKASDDDQVATWIASLRQRLGGAP